ncbi:hypothetical protein MMA231_01389 [Asticcacaulis sp. MM231]|uniref:hypothetical protein n=1 Tax=Asticcacaulis sp. MM231 TaxID=3157666 RepID=UPI0032D5A5E2
MPLQGPGTQVTEQDLHLQTGAYDEVHHAHGYAHVRERHHWYWFAGLGVTAVLALAAGFVSWQVHEIAAPFCASEPGKVIRSPGGTLELNIASVSCFGAVPEQKIFIRRAGQTARGGKAVAAFGTGAKVNARWVSDEQVVISQRGGKIWFFVPRWHDVKFRYR